MKNSTFVVLLIIAIPSAIIINSEIKARQFNKTLFNGPEAIDWLSKNKNPAALASNRFNSTASAILFVKDLYAAGAEEVIIPVKNIKSDSLTLKEEGGPYCDALVIKSKKISEELYTICALEFKREGYKPEKELKHYPIFLWWD